MRLREIRERQRAGEGGFTLIELLIVIAVLAILAGIIIFAVGNSTGNAKTAGVRTERASILSALAAYQSDTGSYPTAAQGLAVLADPATHYLESAPSPSKWLYDPVKGTVVGIGQYAALVGTTPHITGTVTVFAATSLTNVFNDIKAKLLAVNPGLTLNMSYGGSATLKANINGGAPADVFAAADTLNSPNAPFVTSSTNFVSNTLAIITKPGNPSGVATVNDLFTPGLQVILCQSVQPCGNASDQSFAKIGKVRTDLGANLVSQTANVGLVVTGVTTGAPNSVGMVYITDAVAAGATVSTVTIPPANNFTNYYPIYKINSGANPTGGQQFIDYVLSSEGQAFLHARQFGSP